VTKNTQYESVDLVDYFNAILEGAVSIDTLLNKNFSTAVQDGKFPALTSVATTDVTVVSGTGNTSSMEIDQTQGKNKKKEATKKAETVTEKVTIVIDEEEFMDTKNQIEDMSTSITQQVARKEDNSGSTRKMIKVIEKLTGVLFHKFEDAYQKKKKK
jgi:hypothetical protein